MLRLKALSRLLSTSRPVVDVPAGLFLDRNVYRNSDPAAQIVVCFAGAVTASDAVEIRLQGPTGALLKVLQVQTLQTRKLDIRLKLRGLAVGSYGLTGTLTSAGAAPVAVQGTLTRVAVSQPRAAWPATGIPLIVGPAPQGYTGRWGISFGLPLPEGLVSDVKTLLLLETGSTWQPRFGSVNLAPGPSGRPRYGAVDQRPICRAIRKGTTAKLPCDDQSEAPIGGAASEGVGDAESPSPSTTVLYHLFFERAVSRESKSSRSSGLRPCGRPKSCRAAAGPTSSISLAGATTARWTRRVKSLSRSSRASALGFWRAAGTRTRAWRVHRPRDCVSNIVRIEAYADEPFVRISHRTILTYVNADNTFLSDIGFRTVLVRADRWKFGADGRTFSGLVVQNSCAHLVQRRSREFLIREDAAARRLVATGSRSDGWCSAVGPSHRVTAHLRDAVPEIPQGARVGRAGGLRPRRPHVAGTQRAGFQPGRATGPPAHSQALVRPPRRGSRHAPAGGVRDRAAAAARGAGTRGCRGSGLGRRRSDRARPEWRYAGRMPQLGIPYLPVERRVHRGVGRTGGAPGAGFATRARDSGLERRSWVLGRVSAERAADPIDSRLSRRMTGYESAIVDRFEEHGAWIYGDTHNNWDPSRGVPQLHRVWQASHYRVVATAWVGYSDPRRPRRSDGPAQPPAI